MPAAYAVALALASNEETWGLVVNEALACGCPVVVAVRGIRAGYHGIG